jgi:hypothetical protein
MDYEGDQRTVDVHIKRLRERFAEFESDFRIVTIRGLAWLSVGGVFGLSRYILELQSYSSAS